MSRENSTTINILKKTKDSLDKEAGRNYDERITNYAKNYKGEEE